MKLIKKCRNIFIVFVVFYIGGAHGTSTYQQPEAAIKNDHSRTNKICTSCPEMVSIAAGYNTKTFRIGISEVTQSQWASLMGKIPEKVPNCSECPVTDVSWDDVQVYIQKLNQQTKSRYRLPTEAEWEYACRSLEIQDYCGSNDATSVGWHKGNSGYEVHPVQKKQANAFGLYDMSGNVDEWVQDCYSSDCRRRVVRGGSWIQDVYAMRYDYRDGYMRSYRGRTTGFRLAQD